MVSAIPLDAVDKEVLKVRPRAYAAGLLLNTHLQSDNMVASFAPNGIGDYILFPFLITNRHYLGLKSGASPSAFPLVSRITQRRVYVDT